MIVKKRSSLQRLLRMTSINSQISKSKCHKRWYYFAGHRQNVHKMSHRQNVIVG